MIPHTADAFNLLSKLSFKRWQNAWHIYSSYRMARMGRSATIKGLPISIAIEPTTSCNLRCPECPSGLRSFTRPTGMLQQDLFEQIIDEIGDTTMWLTFYFQGEPYLHPGFLKMAGVAAKKGIYTSTSTNAHYLTDEVARQTVESGLDRLIISVDGTTQQSYESYRRGGKLNRVVEGTSHVLNWKKKLKSRTPFVQFQFLVVKPNEHEIPEVYSLAEKLGVDNVVLKTAQIYDYKNGSDLIPDNSRYSRYHLNKDGTFSIKNKLLNHCWKMWSGCVITWDGKIVPCCFDKDAHHVLGDVSEKTFQSVWNSDRYNRFRASIFRSRSEIEMCRNCTEGTKVWT